MTTPTTGNPHLRAAYAAYRRPHADKIRLTRARKKPESDLFTEAVAKEIEDCWHNGAFELATLPSGAAVRHFLILYETMRGTDEESSR